MIGETFELIEDSKLQVFTELAFYLWRVKHDAKGNWCPEIMFNGSEKAIAVMRDTIESMREEFKTHGQSARKFLCNPPEDEDDLRYAKENAQGLLEKPFALERLLTAVREALESRVRDAA